MRRPFQIKGRSGWFAEVEHKDARRQRQHFETKSDATDWLHKKSAAIAAEFAPSFGGPTAVSLGQMLTEYARLYTINKGGCGAELTRINHYLRGARLPALCVLSDAHGRRDLASAPVKRLPTGFVGHRDARLHKRERTYRVIHALGATTVSRITTKHIQELVSTMRADGLSESTVQKEVALLKHAFNEAIKVWGWSLVRNPCVGIRLGGSNRRFVALSEADHERLVAALAACDNPQVWPLCELAISSMLRRGSLLKLQWSQIDLVAGVTHVWTKGFMSDIPLSPRAVEILQGLKAVAPAGTAAVFTMTPNAVNMAWEGVRTKAGLPKLQFRDLRHLGATFYARILNAHELRQALGHKTTAMAEVYVNIARNDVSRALARAEQQLGAARPMPRLELPDGLKKLPRAPAARSPAEPDERLRAGNADTAESHAERVLPHETGDSVAPVAPVVPDTPDKARVAAASGGPQAARPSDTNPPPTPAAAGANVIAFPGRRRA